MSEGPRRLATSTETLRELYLRSGNECAFPGCERRLIDREGNFVGQVCHIEGVKPKSARFNPNQTNEERRRSENLLLMCGEHHIVTNNVREYPVARMRQIKTDHEARFTDVIERIRDTIVDHTAGVDSVLVETGAAVSQVLGWDLSADQLAETVSEFNRLAKKLERIPKSTREFLSVLVDRGREEYGGGFSALYNDVLAACEIPAAMLMKHLEILEHNGIADHEVVDSVAWLRLTPPHLWTDLKLFARQSGIPVRAIVVEGQFDLLD